MFSWLLALLVLAHHTTSSYNIFTTRYRYLLCTSSSYILTTRRYLLLIASSYNIFTTR
jgi:hypothetical protein